MVWGAPGSVPGHGGGKRDRNQIWAVWAYVVPSSAPESATFLFLALREPELGGLTVSYPAVKSELKEKATLCSQACASHLKG